MNNNQRVGCAIFNFRGLDGNRENLLPSKIPCLTVFAKSIGVRECPELPASFFVSKDNS